MNEDVAVVLAQLATKLGTTSEYLWGILLQQAPISAIQSIVQILAFIGLSCLATHAALRMRKICEDGSSDADEIFLILLGSGAIITWVILAIVLCTMIPDILSGLFHPEYWALRQVMGMIKR